jgi:DNA polymerase III delta prime subunit
VDVVAHRVGAPFLPALPAVDPLYLMVGLFFGVMIFFMVGMQVVSRRSPHITYRPEEIDVSLDDVKGLGPVRDEVERTLDLFLAGRSFREDLGGTPRRGVLFEGPPGTGKTYTAKAMAREAGVPFLFVSATSFQSMYYGATAGKIRSYFAALRKAARTEGGAIGFIEEIDAIAMVRGGMPATAAPRLTPATSLAGATACGGLEGLGRPRPRCAALRRVGPARRRSPRRAGPDPLHDQRGGRRRRQRAARADAVLRHPLARAADAAVVRGHGQPRPARAPPPAAAAQHPRRHPAHRRDQPRRRPRPGAAAPGPLRPQAQLRRPDKAGRREIIDFYLGRKKHDAELDDPERRDALAGVTQGYTPVMIENLLDEALIGAMSRGSGHMVWKDLEQARMLVEVGVGTPVGYTPHEERLIATHEAGHATVAWLVAPQRRLEILTIVKRASALGLLAHGDREDVYTRSRAELAGCSRSPSAGRWPRSCSSATCPPAPAGTSPSPPARPRR